MKKQGISLITLVITIVLIIILAGAVILNLADNNPVESAKKATVFQDIDTFRTEFTLKLTTGYTNGVFDTDNINAITKEDVLKYIPSMKDVKIGGVQYNDILVVSEGQLKVDGTKASEAIANGKLTQEQYGWIIEALGNNVFNAQWERVGISAADVKSNPSTYYGKEVVYTPSNGCTVNWRIFLADDNNIYLIADDYVSDSYLTDIGLTSYENRGDLVTKLTTSANYINFKDIDGYAESIVCAPTLEQFAKSYNAVNEGSQVDILECTEGQYVSNLDEVFQDDDNKTNGAGYVLKLRTAEDYTYGITIPTTANKYDLYIKADTTKATAMWLASFSAFNDSYLINVYYDGGLGITSTTAVMGFRPLVKLNNNVRLIDTNGDGVYELIK